MSKYHYKLTDDKGQTRGATQWAENITHRANKGKMILCTNTCIHVYAEPEMASFFNAIHGDFKNPQCWEGKVKGKTISDGCKIGCKEFISIKKVPLPEISTEQRVAIAIKCALRVYAEPAFVKWGQSWLDGTDRSRDAAYAAYAAHAAADDDAYAADDDAYAAYAAHAYAAHAAAYAAAAAADDDAYAAYAAAHAADAKDSNIDILAIIKEVLR